MIFTRLAKMFRFRIPMWLAWAAGLSFTAATAWFMRSSFDSAALASSWEAVKGAPLAVAVVMGVYFTAFALRALVWRNVVPGLTFGHALAAIHLAVAGNHILPLRLGEALRVTSVVKRTSLSLKEATASSLTLRAADALALAGLLVVLGPGLALPRLAASPQAPAARAAATASRRERPRPRPRRAARAARADPSRSPRAR